MNSKILAGTRKLLAIAAALSALIVAGAVKVEKLGRLAHTWALKAAEAAAQKKVEKAYGVYSGLVEQQGTIHRLANDAYAAFNKVADQRDTLKVAIRAELANLA